MAFKKIVTVDMLDISKTPGKDEGVHLDQLDY